MHEFSVARWAGARGWEGRGEGVLCPGSRRHDHRQQHRIVLSPVEAVGLGCFLTLPAWFLRLGKNVAIGRWALVVAALVVVELLDLAE